MAVHFSKEEQEELEKNNAEIYKKRSKESEAEERKSWTWREKLVHFQYYYLKICLVILVVLAMVGLQIYDYFTKDQVALFVEFQGEVLTDETVAALEEELSQHLGFRGREKVRISQGVDNRQIQTHLYSGTIDVMIASEEDFSEWAESDYFLNQNVNDEVAFYADYPTEYRYYSQIMTGEDIRSNLHDTNVEPSDKTEYLCGLSLKDSEKYKQIGGLISDPVAGISAASKHIVEAEQLITYLMDNTQKLETKAVIQ